MSLFLVQVESQICFLLTRLGEGLVAGHLNQELNRELIQHHGDWVSEYYKEYLTYDFHQKLSVSLKMCCRILNNS